MEEEDPEEEDPEEEDPKIGDSVRDSKDESSTDSNITPRRRFRCMTFLGKDVMAHIFRAFLGRKVLYVL